MSTITDRARDFWDRISPRERRLVIIAGIAAPIVLAIWLGLAIHDGLDAMEQRNDHTRKALAVLADLRARGQTHAQVDDSIATMPTLPLSLETYLNTAAKEAHFDLSKVGVTPRTPQEKNGFVTSSVSLTLTKLTIAEAKDFLQRIESNSKYVAVTHLELSADSREKDKITMTLEVSSYSKSPPAKADGSGSGSAGSDGSSKGS
ncbi:MAG TPA: type II secretion system protein GspM [Kofleriaceae bacterium]|nr:type II secretion system protein GspM [Kofleriaceae bacterium]